MVIVVIGRNLEYKTGLLRNIQFILYIPKEGYGSKGLEFLLYILRKIILHHYTFYYDPQAVHS